MADAAGLNPAAARHVGSNPTPGTRESEEERVESEERAVKKKQKTYDSEREFEADRKKMWRKGWLVVEKRLTPVVRPSWAVWGSQADFGAQMATLPLFVLGRLIYRKAPDNRIVVTYERGE